MVWYFIGVYIINRTLHGRLEIRNFSSRVENISLVRYAHSWNIFQHSKKNSVSPRGHVISSMYDKIDIRNTIRETWKQVFGNLAWAVMLLILFPSILQKISKMEILLNLTLATVLRVKGLTINLQYFYMNDFLLLPPVSASPQQ